jgi:hypothetical protein
MTALSDYRNMREAAGKVPVQSANLQNELATLRRSWQRWTRLVEGFTAKSRLRRSIDIGEYRRVHTRLLLSCRAVIELSEDGQRSFYESLEELAKPWMSPRILARTESQFLADLADLCHQAEKQLTGRVGGSGRRLLLGTLGVIGALGAGYFGVSRSAGGIQTLDSLRTYPIMLYRAAIATTYGQRLALGGIILTIALMFIASRVRRR